MGREMISLDQQPPTSMGYSLLCASVSPGLVMGHTAKQKPCKKRCTGERSQTGFLVLGL